MENSTCLWCNEPLTRQKKFCSREHSGKYAGNAARGTKRAVPVLYPCLHCGVLSINLKYCSKSHAAIENNKLPRKHGPSQSDGRRNCVVCGSRLQPKADPEIKFCRKHKKQDLIRRWIEGENIASGPFGNARNWVRPALIELFGEHCQAEGCDWARVHPLTGRVPLQLEHLDGDPHNNLFVNLLMICGGCHTLTMTYCGFNSSASRVKYGRPPLDRQFTRPERMEAYREGKYKYR